MSNPIGKLGIVREFFPFGHSGRNWQAKASVEGIDPEVLVSWLNSSPRRGKVLLWHGSRGICLEDDCLFLGETYAAEFLSAMNACRVFVRLSEKCSPNSRRELSVGYFLMEVSDWSDVWEW